MPSSFTSNHILRISLLFTMAIFNRSGSPHVVLEVIISLCFDRYDLEILNTVDGLK